MNCTIPAVVSSRPVSGGGMSEDEGTTRCARVPRRTSGTAARMSLAFTRGVTPPESDDRSSASRSAIPCRNASTKSSRGSRRRPPRTSAPVPPGGRGWAARTAPPGAAATARTGSSRRCRRRDPRASQNRRRIASRFPRGPSGRPWRRPAPAAASFTSGPDTACSTRPLTRSTVIVILPTDSSMPSTRSSSLLTSITVVLTSPRSGTTSWRTPSSVIFIDSMLRAELDRDDQQEDGERGGGDRVRRSTPRDGCDHVDLTSLLVGGDDRPAGRPVRESYPPGSEPPRQGSPAGLLPLARGLVVAVPLEPGRAVLLLDLVTRVVVRVPVPLAVAEPGSARVVRVAQVQRDRFAGAASSSARPERDDARCSTSAPSPGRWRPPPG